MAKLPTLKRLAIEDFQSQEAWIGPLFLLLNDFMKAVSDALASNITFTDNIASEIKDVDLTYNFTATAPLKLKVTMKPKVLGVVVLRAVENVTSPTALTSHPHVDWVQDGDQLCLKSISGLTVNSNYSLRLLLVGG